MHCRLTLNDASLCTRPCSSELCCVLSMLSIHWCHTRKDGLAPFIRTGTLFRWSITLAPVKHTAGIQLHSTIIFQQGRTLLVWQILEKKARYNSFEDCCQLNFVRSSLKPQDASVRQICINSNILYPSRFSTYNTQNHTSC